MHLVFQMLSNFLVIFKHCTSLGVQCSNFAFFQRGEKKCNPFDDIYSFPLGDNELPKHDFAVRIIRQILLHFNGSGNSCGHFDGNYCDFG